MFTPFLYQILVLSLGFLAVFAALFWILPDADESTVERRHLAKSPALSFSSVASGSFMNDFENYRQSSENTSCFASTAADKTREILDSLMLIFSVADLKADDLKKAADMRVKYYEDDIQSACATRIKANYIVTRNMKDFSESKVTAIKPAELLDRI